VVILGLPGGTDGPPGLGDILTLAARCARHRPVLLLSGGAATDLALPVDLTQVQIIPKPFHRERLRRALLSLLDGDTPTAVRPAEGRANGAVVGQLPAGCRILVAEDNPVSRQLVATLLETHGASVTLAQDGREAWERLSAEAFDLVLMDLHMPEMDGTQVATRVRALEGGGRRVPIVALTADAFDETRRYVLETGLDDYLVKPVDEPALFAVLSRWLEVPPHSGTRPAAGSAAGDHHGETPPPILDREAALRAAGGREDFADELLGMLVKDLVEQQERIARALAEGNLTGLAEAAHGLAGGAAYCGARALREVALALERAARAHDPGEVARHALALEVEAHRLTRAAQVYLDRSATAPAAGREQE